MKTLSPSIGWGRLITWLALTLVAVIVGFAIFFIFMAALGADQPVPDLVADLIMTLCFGSAIGIAQWFVLRAFLQRAALWIPLTLLGFLIASPLLFSNSGNFGPYITLRNALWIGASLGVLLGATQWLLLRKAVRRSLAWIGISLLSWLAAALLAMLFKGLSIQSGPILFWIGLFFSGVILSGLGLVWLLRPAAPAS